MLSAQNPTIPDIPYQFLSTALAVVHQSEVFTETQIPGCSYTCELYPSNTCSGTPITDTDTPISYRSCPTKASQCITSGSVRYAEYLRSTGCNSCKITGIGNGLNCLTKCGEESSCQGIQAERSTDIMTQTTSTCELTDGPWQDDPQYFDKDWNYYERQSGEKIIEFETNVLDGFDHQYCLKCLSNVDDPYTSTITMK